MVNVGLPSTGVMIGFVISVLVISLGVAFAPEVKAMVFGLKRKVAK